MSNDEDDLSREQLIAELELLTEQYDQLTESYVRSQQAQYRKTALGLGVVGICAIAGGIAFPNVRRLLITLGAIGIFGGVLTYYLSPEQVAPASVGRSVADVLASDRVALIEELTLTEQWVYVPVGQASTRVQLFVPQYEHYTIPADEELTNRLVISEQKDARGVSFRPTGDPLFDAFEETLADSLADAHGEIVRQVAGALVEQFELMQTLPESIDVSANQVTLTLEESVYGPLDQFDHPVVSVLAVGLARGLNTPVTVDIRVAEATSSEYILSFQLDTPERAKTNEQ